MRFYYFFDICIKIATAAARRNVFASISKAFASSPPGNIGIGFIVARETTPRTTLTTAKISAILANAFIFPSFSAASGRYNTDRPTLK